MLKRDLSLYPYQALLAKPTAAPLPASWGCAEAYLTAAAAGKQHPIPLLPARAAWHTVRCWEQSRNRGHRWGQPLWSRSSTLTGAVRARGFMSLYTFRIKNQNSAPAPRSLQSCFPASICQLFPSTPWQHLSAWKLQRRRKKKYPQTYRQAFLKLGDCPSATHESQHRPQSRSLILISDTEFYSSWTNVILLYQNAVYQKSGLFARTCWFAYQFYIYSCAILLTRMLMKVLTHSLCHGEIF